MASRLHTDLVIAGCSAPDVLMVLAQIERHDPGRFNLLGFTDIDDRFLKEGFEGLPVWPQSELRDAVPPDCSIYVNVASTMKARRRVVEDLRAAGFDNFPALVEPKAVFRDVEVGEGTLVTTGALVGPRARLGAFNVLALGANVNHDCRLGDFTFIGPNATVLGRAVLEDDSYVGGNATVLPGRVVGAGAIVGAGAVVTRNVAPFSTVVGSPARPVSSNSS